MSPTAAVVEFGEKTRPSSPTSMECDAALTMPNKDKAIGRVCDFIFSLEKEIPMEKVMTVSVQVRQGRPGLYVGARKLKTHSPSSLRTPYTDQTLERQQQAPTKRRTLQTLKTISLNSLSRQARIIKTVKLSSLFSETFATCTQNMSLAEFVHTVSL